MSYLNKRTLIINLMEYSGNQTSIKKDQHLLFPPARNSSAHSLNTFPEDGASRKIDLVSYLPKIPATPTTAPEEERWPNGAQTPAHHEEEARLKTPTTIKFWKRTLKKQTIRCSKWRKQHAAPQETLLFRRCLILFMPFRVWMGTFRGGSHSMDFR
ncbi:hypothetical protein TWF694_010691 [Orbilia ellipsospora]|uniref:Uncharacterized protein n=1 Tax=Orbilia ellipsospora TaxID=2528407 RepID=A0AAV9XCY9_9PEZI